MRFLSVNLFYVVQNLVKRIKIFVAQRTSAACVDVSPPKPTVTAIGMLFYSRISAVYSIVKIF